MADQSTSSKEKLRLQHQRELELAIPLDEESALILQKTHLMEKKLMLTLHHSGTTKDTNFKKDQFVPSPKNNYNITSFVNVGDLKSGLESAPLWIYTMPFTMIRCDKINFVAGTNSMVYGISNDVATPYKMGNFADDFVGVKVFTANSKLIKTAQKYSNLTLNNFDEVSSKLAKLYNPSAVKYPLYLQQTQRYKIQPYGKPPTIDNINVKSIKMEKEDHDPKSSK